MKNFYFFLIFIFVFVYANANPIDSLTAKTVAENFYVLNSNKTIHKITLGYTDYADDGTPAYFVFNINDNDGWVMVSADDGATPILGYNTIGHFIDKNLPPQFLYWKNMYKKQITEIKLQHIQSVEKIKMQWQDLNQSDNVSNHIMKSNGLTPAQPAFYLLKTFWDQSPGYNYLCPQYSGDKISATGCVATAMAQIMKYWNYPNKNMAEIPSYTTKTQKYQINGLANNANLYHWDNMPINSSSDEIAKLMYDCGRSVQMDYNNDGKGSSGAWVIISDQNIDGRSSSAEYSFKKIFGYNPQTIIGIKRFYNQDDWLNILRTELDNSRPILYVGFTSDSAGHAWVCDGHDANNLFHMNWGWGGLFNGYYSVDNLNPSYVFDDLNSQEALIGIQPTCQTADLQFVSMPTVYNTAPSVGSAINVSCQEYNAGSTYAGSNVVKVYISSSETLYNNYIELGTISFGGLSQGATSGTETTQITIPSSLTPGVYYIHFWADANQTVDECIENNNFAHIQINVTSSTNTCPTPSNNNAAGAISILENSSAISGTSCGATGDASYTTCTSLYPDDDVFYKFTATTSTVTVNVSPSSGTDYNPAFQLLSGSSLSNLQSVSPDCINNYGVGQPESQTYTNLITGNTYYIRVWHASTGYGTYGTFYISVSGTSCISPGAPYSLSPGTSSATGQIITTTTPALTWNIPSGANGYQVNISKYPYGYYNIVYTSDYLQTNSLTVPSGVLLNGYNYRWDVTAYSSQNSSCYTTSADSYISVNTGSTCSIPTTQSSNLTFTGIDANDVTVNWTVGNGERHIVKINTSNSFTNITNGSTTNPNTIYAGSGEQIVYDGSGNYVTVSGLSPNTIYYFKVYDANCSGSMSMYNNNTAINNPASVTTITNTTTCTAPTTQASGVIFSNVGTNSMTINWINGNGNKRIVKVNTFYGFTQPTNGVDPSWSNFWNNSGEQVIYNGSGNSVTLTGLSANTQYCFKVFEANCSGTNIVYAANTNNNGGCQSTQQTCTPPTVIPTPGTGDAVCSNPYPYALHYNASGYNLYWTDNYGSAYYDIEVYEYPYNSNNLVYSQNCINDHSTTVPANYLQPGKLYCWRVKMSVYDCNCYGSWSQMYFFGIIPVINELTQDMVVCNGQGITLTTPIVNVPSPGSVQYLWYHKQWINNNWEDVYMGSGNTFYADNDHSGSIFIKLSYSGSSVCTGIQTTMMSNPHFVKIGTTPSAPTITSNSPVCEGNRLTLTATPPDDENYTYWWNGPNGFSSNNSSISIDAVSSSNAGTYTCYLVGSYLNTDAPGCPGATATTTVVVNPAPSASFIYSVSNNTVTFTNNSINSQSYSWDFGDGQTSNQQSLSHTYTANGTYLACLTANGTSGCNPSNYCQLITIGENTPITTLPTFVKVFNDLDIPNTIWNPSEYVQSTIDSSYVCVGTYYNLQLSENIIRYFKIDKAGNLVWAKEFPNDPYYYQSSNKIIESINGFLIGFTYGSSTANIMEIDSNGNILWTKKINNAGGITGINKKTDGYILTSGTSHGLDIYKIDFSGNIMWEKRWIFNIYTNTSGGNSTNVFYRDLLSDINGNFYSFGSFSDNASSNNWQSYNGLISKFDSNGNHIWTKTYVTSIHDDITGLTLDNNSNIIFENYSVDNSNNYLYFVGKLNSSGTLITSQQLPNNNGWIQLINCNVDNSVNCIVGNSISKGFITLSNGLNSINQQKNINFKSYSFKPTLDGNFAGVSQYPFNTSAGDYRYGFEKYSFSNTSCNDTDSSSFSFSPISVTLGSITPISDTSTLTLSNLSLSNNNITLTHFDICHTCDLSAIITPNGDTTFTQGGSVTLSANAGMSSYLWSNGATTPSIEVTSTGSYTVTVTDYYGCINTSNPVDVTVNSGLGYTSIYSYVKIYPNPTDGTFILKSDKIFNQIDLQIFNSLGETVYKNHFNNEANPLNKKIQLNIPAGIYFIKLNVDEIIYTDELIIVK